MLFLMKIGEVLCKFVLKLVYFVLIDEVSCSKKPRDKPPKGHPFATSPVGQQWKTGEIFLQDKPCFQVTPKVTKCRECRYTREQHSSNNPNASFCRFYAFRRLRYAIYLLLHFVNSQVAVK